MKISNLPTRELQEDQIRYPTRHPQAMELWVTVANSVIYNRFRVTKHQQGYVFSDGWRVGYSKTVEQAQQIIDRMTSR